MDVQLGTQISQEQLYVAPITVDMVRGLDLFEERAMTFITIGRAQLEIVVASQEIYTRLSRLNRAAIYTKLSRLNNGAIYTRL